MGTSVCRTEIVSPGSVELLTSMGAATASANPHPPFKAPVFDLSVMSLLPIQLGSFLAVRTTARMDGSLGARLMMNHRCGRV